MAKKKEAKKEAKKPPSNEESRAATTQATPVTMIWPYVLISFLAAALVAFWFFLHANVETSSTTVDYSLGPDYPIPKSDDFGFGLENLCDTLQQWNETLPLEMQRSNVVCIGHTDGFDVVHIFPKTSQGGILALVLAAPTTNHWSSSALHQTILYLVSRVSWLKHHLLIVSPRKHKKEYLQLSLEEAVESFVATYTKDGGDEQLGHVARNGPILRLLTVQAELEPNAKKSFQTLRILPHGYYGKLPHPQVLTTALGVFSEEAICASQEEESSVVTVHPFSVEEQMWRRWVQTQEDKESLERMGRFSFFVASHAAHYHAPHAPALDKGIESLTVDVRLGGKDLPTRVAQHTQKLEALIRAFDDTTTNNNTTKQSNKYWVTASKEFISQVDELGLILLLLSFVPLLVKLIGLGLPSRDKLFSAFLSVALIIPSSAVLGRVEESALNPLFLVTYVSYIGYVQERLLPDHKGSAHVAGIILVMVLHAALLCYDHCYGTDHTATMVVSGWFWAAIFGLTPTDLRSNTPCYAGCVVMVILWPPIVVMPFVFGTCTPYLLLVYTPLHMLASALWLPITRPVEPTFA